METSVRFCDASGNATDAQLLAFEDTWHWGPSAEATYAYLTNTARHEGRVPAASLLACVVHLDRFETGGARAFASQNEHLAALQKDCEVSRPSFDHRPRTHP